MSEQKSVSLGERWRRDATRGVDDKRLAAALELLPAIRTTQGDLGLRYALSPGMKLVATVFWNTMKVDQFWP